MEKAKNLRIKKVFLEEILKGKKTSEFRNFNKYYINFFGVDLKNLDNEASIFMPLKTNLEYLIFHYQSPIKVIAKISSLSLVLREDYFLKPKPHLNTKYIFKIDLESPSLLEG